MENFQQRNNDLQTKIDLVNLTIREIQLANTGTDEAETLLSILEEYERFLVRQRLRMETSFDDFADIKQAIRDAGCLLVDVIEGEQDAMLGWYQGVTPRNMTQAFANLLTRIVMELSGFVNAVESHYPELKDLFDRERRHHAALIQAKEMDELHGNS